MARWLLRGTLARRMPAEESRATQLYTTRKERGRQTLMQVCRSWAGCWEGIKQGDPPPCCPLNVSLTRPTPPTPTPGLSLPSLPPSTRPLPSLNPIFRLNNVQGPHSPNCKVGGALLVSGSRFTCPTRVGRRKIA